MSLFNPILIFLPLLSFAFTAFGNYCNFKLQDEVKPNDFLGSVFERNRPRPPYVSYSNPIVYSLIDDEKGVSRYFRMEPKTGRLYCKTALDRDKLCDEVRQCCNPSQPCQFNLEVVIQPPKGAPNFKRCVVDVQDTNDNAPKFPVSQFTVKLKENLPVGSTVALKHAVDLDSRSNAVQNYDTVSPLPRPFRLRKVTSNGRAEGLMLELIQPLDREKQDKYKFIVRAIDGGSPPLTGSMTVFVQVLDHNDNPPRFLNSSYHVSVNEGFIPPKPILKLTAKDNDIGENAVTIYDFASSVPNKVKEYFNIDSTTGNIFLKKKLDFEEEKSFRFQVTASDSFGHPTSAVADVRVDVIDFNDEKPKVKILFVNGDTRSGGNGFRPIAQVPENAGPDQFIAYFSVVDRDTGNNGIVNCSLPYEKNPKFVLRLKKKQGTTTAYVIKTTQRLDREETPKVDLIINCWDRGDNPHNVRTILSVRVLDENDNTPVLSLSGDPQVHENRKPGTRVVKVDAVDPDEGANGTLVYSMEQSPGEAKRLFRIASRTGEITTRISIDRESQEPPLSKIPVVVTVRDRGIVPRTGTLSFDIDIIDENDNAPKFQEDLIEMSVMENLPAHQQVGEIRVVDKDSKGHLRVSIGKQDRQVPFIVHSVAGKFFLNTTKSLNREKKRIYTFTIVANDDAKEVPASCKVIVEDENDNAPQIIYPNTQNKTVTVSWREFKNFHLLRVNVKDPDNLDPHDAQHFFELQADTDILDIEPTSGAVFIQRKMRESDVGSYLITVIVRDSGSPPRTSKVQFILKVDRTQPNNRLESGGPSLPTDHPQRNLEGDIILIVVLVFVLILLVVIIVLLIYVRHWKQSSFDLLPDLFVLCCPYQSRSKRPTGTNSRTPRQRRPEVENDKLTAGVAGATVDRKLSNLSPEAGAPGSPDFFVTNSYDSTTFGKTAVKYQTIGGGEEAEALRAAVAGHEYHEIDHRTGTVRPTTDSRYYDALVNGPPTTLGRQGHLYQTLYPGDAPRRDKRPGTGPNSPGGPNDSPADFATSPKARREPKSVSSSRSDSNVTSTMQRVCLPDMGSQQTTSESAGPGSTDGFSPKHKTFSSYSMAMRGGSPEQVYTRSYPHVEASFV